MPTTQLMVSIHCIAYNQAPYIRQCLEGFVMQKTNFKFEAIVHDDASTDGTADIIRAYAKKYPNIIKPILETENQYSKGTLGEIMNSHLHGKYVAFCEGDDYWTDPNKLQRQVEYMEENPDCSLCFHNYYLLDPNGSTLRKAHDQIKDSYSKNEIFYFYPFHTSTVVIKREVLFSEILKEAPIVKNGDTRMFLAATYLGKNHGINSIMSCYRMSAGVTKNILTNGIPMHITKTIIPLAKYYKIRGWKKHFLPRMILMSSYQFRFGNFKMFFQTLFVSFRLSPLYATKGIGLTISDIIIKMIKHIVG